MQIFYNGTRVTELILLKALCFVIMVTDILNTETERSARECARATNKSTFGRVTGPGGEMLYEIETRDPVSRPSAALSPQPGGIILVNHRPPPVTRSLYCCVPCYFLYAVSR